nr:hypothetical protein L204_05315 [Cryptococcus depauperatus CBS 7855]
MPPRRPKSGSNAPKRSLNDLESQFTFAGSSSGGTDVASQNPDNPEGYVEFDPADIPNALTDDTSWHSAGRSAAAGGSNVNSEGTEDADTERRREANNAAAERSRRKKQKKQEELEADYAWRGEEIRKLNENITKLQATSIGEKAMLHTLLAYIRTGKTGLPPRWSFATHSYTADGGTKFYPYGIVHTDHVGPFDSIINDPQTIITELMAIVESLQHASGVPSTLPPATRSVGLNQSATSGQHDMIPSDGTVPIGLSWPMPNHSPEWHNSVAQNDFNAQNYFNAQIDFNVQTFFNPDDLSGPPG